MINFFDDCYHNAVQTSKILTEARLLIIKTSRFTIQAIYNLGIYTWSNQYYCTLWKIAKIYVKIFSP